VAPEDVAIDASGNLFVTNYNGNTVQEIHYSSGTYGESGGQRYWRAVAAICVVDLLNCIAGAISDEYIACRVYRNTFRAKESGG